MEDTEQGSGADGGHGGFRGFIEWLDEKLYPALGPPPLGPYGPIVERIGVAVCPVCSHPMAEHTIERSLDDTILHCPVEHLPPPRDDRPLDELGMPRRDG